MPKTRAFKTIFVDCGFIVKMLCDADKFQVGDYIKARGRLDVHLVKKKNKNRQ